MRKIYSILAAGLLLASCSSDNLEGVKGSEQEVAITVELPSGISSRVASSDANSALGGVSNNKGANVTFTAALYYGNNQNPVWTGEATTTAEIHAVTFKPTLVVGETYRLVSYAQFDGAADLTAQEEAFGLNDELQDAYFVSEDIVAEPVMSAVLKRPTGKLRLIANDYAEMQRQLGKDIATVEVTYKDARFTTFDSKAGTWSGAATTNVYKGQKTAYANEADADEITVFADYIPVNTTTGEEHVSIVVDVTFDDGTHFTREINLDIPIKRNYLTTLVGDFFTSEMELTLVIDEVFDNEEEYNYNELATAFELGGEFKLEEDVTLREPLTLAAGKTLVLDLNGYNITTIETPQTDAIVVDGGTLTINGEGTVTASYDPIWAKGNAVVTINGGSYVGLDSEAVYAKDNAQVTINGGTFEAKTPYSGTLYTLNLQDKSNASIVVKGGTFVNFNPADNKAENPAVNFVAEGYSSYESEAGVWTVVEGQAVADAASLANILTSDSELLTVTLVDDIDVAITSLGSQTPGSGEYKLGGENTKNITIDLNGKKLNITTKYWSAIGAKNDDATITIKNGTMTSTGNSAATWNANDVRLCNCNYVIEDVTFEKEVALDNAGKSATLTNVTINGTGDYYALWITAEGQNVTVDNLKVATAGRAIKIDEQYVDSPALVTLNVSNSSFESAKKAAVLVKSAAGAQINWGEGNDISKVAADKVNAVWVDADAAAYANLVTANGASVIVEP